MLQDAVWWERVLDKYGLPLAFLAVVLAFLWFVGRPVVKYLLDMINTQLSESRAVRAKDTQDFLAELKAQRESDEAHTRAFADALKLLDVQRGARK